MMTQKEQKEQLHGKNAFGGKVHDEDLERANKEKSKGKPMS